MRIFLHIPDTSASSYYRSVLPFVHCYHELSLRNIKLVSGKQPESGEPFDVYVFQRIIKPQFWAYIKELTRRGSKIVWQTDDDIFNIPTWNPAHQKVTVLDKNVVTEIIESANSLVVSTQRLAETIKQKTIILPNLIDEMDFTKYPTLENQPVKILWTGSYTHSEDLSQLVEPIYKIIEKYGDKVKFIFWGFFPSALFDLDKSGIFKPRYPKNMAFLNWMEGNQYFELLSKLKPDIALGPLADCEFNRCKSNLRSLEMSMVGAAFIGSNIEPYRWIDNGQTGFLVQDQWYDAMCELIEDEKKRKMFVWNAQEQIKGEYSWQSNSKYKWIEAFESFA